jgi:hypothetical protein
MRALFLTLLFTLGFSGFIGCGSKGGGGGTGGATIVGGRGGSLPAGTGGAGGAPYDGGLATPDAIPDLTLTSPETETTARLDAQATEGGTIQPNTGCAGLTEAQCHDLIINPTVVPDGVLQLDPGAKPAVPYPTCTAM